MIPMYPKDRVYIDPNTEYSIDELRAPRYLRNISNRLHVPQLETCQAVQSILEGVEAMQESLHEVSEVYFTFRTIRLLAALFSITN